MPRDVLGQFLHQIDSNIRKELYSHYHISKTSSNQKFEELRKGLKGGKLAIIYLLDASEFRTYVLPPKNKDASEKWWNRKKEQKSKEIRQRDRYFRQSTKNR